MFFSAWLTVEEGEGKSKKVTRVIAPSRKPNKAQPQTQPKSKGGLVLSLMFYLNNNALSTILWVELFLEWYMFVLEWFNKGGDFSSCLEQYCEVKFVLISSQIKIKKKNH